MIEAVIFDLDNTLINRKEAFKSFSEQFIDRFVVINNNDHKLEVLERIQKADRDGYRNKRELYTELMMTLVMKNSDTTVEELLRYWFDEFFKCTLLMNGAKEVLNKLKEKRIKLGLITNGSVHSQNSKIDQAGLRDNFDVIIVSDEVQVKKPDKKIFELALQQLNVSAKYSWYIGDHPINDIKGAADAGINTVWLKGFMDWDDSLAEPVYTISNLLELIDIVEDAEPTCD